jgi:hypothetical protein
MLVLALLLLGASVTLVAGCANDVHGPFACGGHLCHSATQYCLHTVFQGGCAELDGYECVELPKRCQGAPSCDCFPQMTLDYCEEPACDDQSGVIRVCEDGSC